MDIDALKSLLNNFNPQALLPDLSSMTGRVALALRIACLIGPLVMLVLGLLYYLTPAKEANYSFGYRTHRGMASVESWRFTQKLAGICWSCLGLLLTVIMLVLCGGFQKMEITDMVSRAFVYVLWEIGLLIVCGIAIWVTVIVLFDRQGVRRNQK